GPGRGGIGVPVGLGLVIGVDRQRLLVDRQRALRAGGEAGVGGRQGPGRAGDHVGVGAGGLGVRRVGAARRPADRHVAGVLAGREATVGPGRGGIGVPVGLGLVIGVDRQRLLVDRQRALRAGG